MDKMELKYSIEKSAEWTPVSLRYRRLEAPKEEKQKIINAGNELAQDSLDIRVWEVEPGSGVSVRMSYNQYR